MSSEIFNQNYGQSIYNLRLNSINFSSKRNKFWYKDEPDTFVRGQIDGVPIETKAKILGNELIRMVEQRRVSTSKIQQAVTKYLPNTKVKIVSMDNYTELGINTKKNIAAATRPVFDKNGKLQKLEIFIPNINYDDKKSEYEYIEKLTHELTHAMQYAEDTEIREEYKNTPEGHFYNFFQQNFTNMLTDTIVLKTLVNLAKENHTEMSSIDDYNKFIGTEAVDLSNEKIMSLLGYDNREDFNNYVKTRFSVYIDELMRNTQANRDPFALNIIDKAGGIDRFKSKIMRMTAHTLSNEKEAYIAGNTAKKTAQNLNRQDNYDAVPAAIGLVSEALYS